MSLLRSTYTNAASLYGKSKRSSSFSGIARLLPLRNGIKPSVFAALRRVDAGGRGLWSNERV